MSFLESVLAGTVVLFASVATAAAGLPEGHAPVFSQPNYNVVVDVSPPGLETFTISGSVSDADAADLVTVIIDGQDPFMRFSTTPGNPATFTLTSIGLTYNDRGVYDGFFGAFDNSTRQQFASAPWRVTIVPEPSILGIFAGGITLVMHRRVRKS